MMNHDEKCMPNDDDSQLASSFEGCCSHNKEKVSCCRKEEEKIDVLRDNDPTLFFQKEAEEWKDKYVRALAEMENVRKRVTREKIESQGFAIQNVLTDFLQPFDQLEVALEHAEKAPQEVKVWAIGFQMILEQFKQLFLSYDVQVISGVGAIFDTNLHEAIEIEESLEVADGTILQVFQKGYKMGARTIRPAKVKVAAAPKNMKESEETL